MAVSRENKNREIFIETILKKFKNKITGEDEKRVCINPEDKFFVGKLSTAEERNDMNSSKTFITQIGVDFIIKKKDINKTKINIIPKGEFYYRVNPTMHEQRKAIENEYKISNNVESITYEEIRDDYYQNNKNKKFEYKITPIYEKIIIDEKFGVSVDLSEIYNKEKQFGYVSFKDELTEKIDYLIRNIQKQNKLYRINRSKIKINDLNDNESWIKYLNKSRVEVIPRWSIKISLEIKNYTEDLCKVSIYIINDTKVDVDSGKENKQNNKKLITTMFNAGLKIEIDGTDYQPIELNYFCDDYKYDRYERAIGNNCSIMWNNENKKVIETTNIPVFVQKRLKTRSDLVVKFIDLIEKPVITLNNIYEEMKEELQKLITDFENRKNTLGSSKKDNKIAKEKFKKEIKAFRFEIERFKNGIEKIDYYNEIRQAFIFMNKAFSKTSKGYDSWRLFQIVFIVSLIPDICVSEYGEKAMGEKCKIDEVDVLYFPTGGGKTEAFLGITIFTMFFDRIRGKLAGVSSVIKYPLRLLSVQQVQRVADILASAEIIRRDCISISKSDQFSLGYYVGDINTPNKLDKKNMEEIEKEDQRTLNNKYKVIDVCPFCGESNINVVLDKKLLRLKHICLNNECQSGGVLPLYVVDKEIYRYLPTVLISTIDKIAAVGYQKNFRNIIGEVQNKCPLHGYTSMNKCTEYDVCKEDAAMFESVNIKDAAPTLLIQDELHLVRESLGVFDSHYETLYQYMIKELTNSKKKIKIIGATATISSYEYQLQHLYGKNGLRFPCESPYLKRNFYSFIDDQEVHRFIVGYAPYSKAIVNSVVYSMKYLREIVWEYYIDPQKLINIDGISIKTEKEALKILEDYWIFLQYNNVKQDGNKVLGAVDTPINVELNSQNIQQFDYRKMTGDDTFQDVRKVLAEVENTKDVFSGFNLIAATSMISHGVDADKFNSMVFFGMPGNTAEYIQAYSRVGRKYPGIVIVLLRPTRDKDVSYLKHFIKFHEYKNILVDPVPINRWATRAINKTFPGLFQGIILNYYDKILQYEIGDMYKAKNVKRAIEMNKILKEDILVHILRGYRCIYENDITLDLGKQYKRIIEKNIDKVFNEILSKEFTNKDFFPHELKIILGEKVMTSLRDSNEQVKISLD